MHPSYADHSRITYLFFNNFLKLSNVTKYSFTKPISFFFFCYDNKILQYSKLIKRNFENVLHTNFNIIKILHDRYVILDRQFLQNFVQFLIKIEKKKNKKQKSRGEKCVMYTYPEPPWFCFVIILWIFKFSFFFFLLFVINRRRWVPARLRFNKIRTPSVSLQSLASRKVLKFLIHLSWFLSNTLRESLLPKEALDRLK